MAGKKPVKSKSLSALAAGLSARQVQPASARPVQNPLVAALARKADVSRKVVAGLMSRSAVVAASKNVAPLARAPERKVEPPRPLAKLPQRPVVQPRQAPVVRAAAPAVRPVAERAQPQSRPGPSSGIAPGMVGTSRPASVVASLVKSAEQSRAAPAKAAKMTPQQLAESRRQYPRADLQVKARLSLADDPSHFFEAALPTANVSVGGMFLASTFFLKLKTKLEVRLSLPPHGREVHVKGEVVRVEERDAEHSGFALRFTEYLEGSEVVLATHFLSPVLREFIQHYAKGNGFKPNAEYLAHTADVLAAWELRRAQLGGDVWVVPGDRS